MLLPLNSLFCHRYEFTCLLPLYIHSYLCYKMHLVGVTHVCISPINLLICPLLSYGLFVTHIFNSLIFLLNDSLLPFPCVACGGWGHKFACHSPLIRSIVVPYKMNSIVTPCPIPPFVTLPEFNCLSPLFIIRLFVTPFNSFVFHLYKFNLLLP